MAARKRTKPRKPRRPTRTQVRRKTLREALADVREVVFQRDQYRCVGPVFGHHCQDTQHLQLAHVASRRFLATRLEPDNLLTLCASCHRAWHDRPADYGWWFCTVYPERIAHIRELLSPHLPKSLAHPTEHENSPDAEPDDA